MQAKIRQVAMALALLSPLFVGTVLSHENATAPITANLHRILIRNLTSIFYAGFSFIRSVRCEYRVSPRQEINDIFGLMIKLPCSVC